MSNSKEIFAKNIQTLLKMNRINRNEVADYLGVKYTTFCDWAKGRSYPKMEYITKIAEYFKIKPYALTEENPDFEKAYMDALMDKVDIGGDIEIYMYDEKKSMMLKSVISIPLVWIESSKCREYLGLMLPDNCMEPVYIKNDIIIASHSGYVDEGDYLIRNIKTSKLAFRRLNIKDDQVILYPLNPNNELKDITRYLNKDDFLSKYEIYGKIKRHIRDFD